MPSSPTADLRITFQQLEVFCRVVELRSVTRVAEERHVAQPSVTGHLRALEQRLGAKLLYWRGRQMHLTEAGELTLSWARTVLGETESFGRDLRGLRSGSGGSVTIGATPSLGTYLVPSMLFDLRQSVPDIHFVLRVFDASTIATQLEQSHLDFAVLTLDAPPQSARVTWRQTGVDEMILVGAPGAFSTGTGSLEAVSALPHVCPARGQNTRRLIDSQLAAYGAQERTIAMECGTPETIKAAVREGLGVAFLSRHAVAAELGSGALVELPSEVKVKLPVLVGFVERELLNSTQKIVLNRLISGVSSMFCGAADTVTDRRAVG